MLWSFLLVGYAISIAVETPILMLGLSSEHPFLRRFLAGLWLTACTYPIVILVMPHWFTSRAVYLAVAETFAAVAECLLFLAAFGWQGRPWRGVIRDCSVIVVANLASFGVGEWLRLEGWFEGIV
jgi:hypothetical protein